MNNYLGVLLHGSTVPSELADLSRFVEDHGFAELWLSEDYFLLAGFASAGIALQATGRIPVGLGVVASVVRHPAVTAMEIATLAGAFPGRVYPGIGHGVPAWTRQMGMYPKSVLGTLRESITGIRRLLAGETYSAEGHFHFDQVSLQHPVDGVPLYTGVLGPKSLALSGEIADGTILSAMSGPRYVARAKEITSAAAKSAGRSGDHKLPTFVLYSIDRNRERARSAARSFASFYLAEMGPSPVTSVYGIDDELAAMIERGGAEQIHKDMPDEWLDWLSVSGEPDECVERITALHRSGATSVIVGSIPTETTREQLQLTAAEVLPKL